MTKPTSSNINYLNLGKVAGLGMCQCYRLDQVSTAVGCHLEKCLTEIFEIQNTGHWTMLNDAPNGPSSGSSALPSWR